MAQIEIIGAGAGSGKTYKLTEKVLEALAAGVRPSGIFATTYTIKAAGELKDRIRQRLVENNRDRDASQLDAALIGTVHSTFAQLVRKHAFELGLSPTVDIIGEGDDQMIFRRSLAGVVDSDRSNELDTLVRRFTSSAAKPEDWREIASDIAEQARVNRISPGILLDQAEQSIEDITRYLPPVSQDSARSDARDALRQALPLVIRELQESGDSAQNTARYVLKLEAARAILSTPRGVIPWPDWSSLFHSEVGARSREKALIIRDIVEPFESFQELRNNIKRFVQLLFSVAADALESYETFKRERGLLDFVDLEVKMVELLELPRVANRIKEDVDALFVDEFQDTSPIQLEAFLKLSRLVDRVIWVGDPKQSIFAFRHAEPKLMGAVVNAIAWVSENEINTSENISAESELPLSRETSVSRALEKSLDELAALDQQENQNQNENRKQAVEEGKDNLVSESEPGLFGQSYPLLASSGHFNRLEYNWRSRPEIVHFCNAVFDRVFEQEQMGKVGLSAKRASQSSHTEAIRVWSFEKSNGKKVRTVKEQAPGIVRRVQHLLNAGLEVEDKESHRMRALRLRDVAILARTNRELDYLAAAFKFAGIPAAVTTPGLLATPESRLLCSLLRRVLNSSDTLAVAELMVLGDAVPISQVLEERLSLIQSGEEDEIRSWGADHTAIRELDEIGRLRGRLSPGELVDLVIVRTELRYRVASWGNAESRLSNLDACRKLARQYERQQKQLGQAATLGGMLRWWMEIHQRRLDYVDPDPELDAVQLLTYHKSKGLEWPVVICCSLGDKIEPRLWGVATIDDRPLPELQNLLDKRRVRFRFNPFGSKTQRPLFYQQLRDAEYAQAFRDELGEARRLLYVGLTRPRDYLFLVDSGTNVWPGSAWTGNSEKSFSLTAAWNDLIWDGRRVPLAFEPSFSISEGFLPSNPEPVYSWPRPIAKGNTSRKKKYLSPSKDRIPLAVDSTDIGELVLGDRIQVSNKTKDSAIGDVIHAFLAADRDDRAPAERLQMAQAHLYRFGVQKHLKAEDLVTVSDRFRHYLERRFPDAKHHREMTVRAKVQGQIVQGYIDWLVESEEGNWIFDHKTFRGNVSAAKDKIREFEPQLQAYSGIVQQATGRKTSATVYWALRGEGEE